MTADETPPASQPWFPLTMASPGEDVRLVEIRGGHQMRKRLADLGLNLGMPLRVVNANGGGPLIIAVRDCRLGLGRGMAHRIMVAPLLVSEDPARDATFADVND